MEDEEFIHREAWNGRQNAPSGGAGTSGISEEIPEETPTNWHGIELDELQEDGENVYIDCVSGSKDTDQEHDKWEIVPSDDDDAKPSSSTESPIHLRPAIYGPSTSPNEFMETVERTMKTHADAKQAVEDMRAKFHLKTVTGKGSPSSSRDAVKEMPEAVKTAEKGRPKQPARSVGHSADGW